LPLLALVAGKSAAEEEKGAGLTFESSLGRPS
jgi:hypothetical protein